MLTNVLIRLTYRLKNRIAKNYILLQSLRTDAFCSVKARITTFHSILRALGIQFDEHFYAPFISHFPKVFLQLGEKEESSHTAILFAFTNMKLHKRTQLNHSFQLYQYQWRSALWWSLWCKFPWMWKYTMHASNVPLKTRLKKTFQSKIAIHGDKIEFKINKK